MYIICVDSTTTQFTITEIFQNRDVQIGDIVTVGECRPLSKTVTFNVIKVAKGTGSSKKAFQKM